MKTPQDHDNARRDFLLKFGSSLAGITMISTLAPLIAGCESSTGPASMDPNFRATYDVSSLTVDGTAMVTATNGGDGTPIVLVRNSATTYTALSMSCTHEGCVCRSPSNGTINCDCHGSQFDLTGAVRRGPATTALYRYKVAYDSTGHSVTVTP